MTVDALLARLACNSLRGSLLILAVLLLRLLLHNTPRRLACLLWGLVALRMAVPVRLECSFGLIPLAPQAASAVVNAANVGGTGAAATTALAGVWLAGAVMLLLYACFRWRRVLHSVRNAVRAEDGTWVCDRISVPFILLTPLPKIYLPGSISAADRAWALAHERAHLRRGDPWWKLLGFLLLALYWYQPLCWLGWFAFCRDLELACDEAVTAKLPLQERKAYALALVNCCGPAASPLSALSFCASPVKARVLAVLRVRRQSAWITVLAALLWIGAMVGLAMEPVSALRPAASYRSEPPCIDARPVEKTIGSMAQAESAEGMIVQLWLIPNGEAAPEGEGALAITLEGFYEASFDLELNTDNAQKNAD